MKRVCVITEGQSDHEILKVVLPKEIVQNENIEFIVGSGRYSAQSLARSVLAVEQVPTALIVDADTSDEAAIQEQRELLSFSLRQASPGIKFEVFLAVPEMEILLVQNSTLRQQLTNGQEFSELELEFAKLHPKKFLRRFLKPTESYSATLSEILKNLNEQTIKTMQEYPLVKQLNEFLLSLVQVQPV